MNPRMRKIWTPLTSMALPVAILVALQPQGSADAASLSDAAARLPAGKFATLDGVNRIDGLKVVESEDGTTTLVLSGTGAVVHAAALKIVPSAEYDPFETVKTNIIGAMNVIDVAIDRNVEKLVALSTDKACLPINLYGGSKLVSDKLFISGNQYSRPESTKFAVVRYGNVMGSRGSIIPLFRSQISQGFVTITDKRMTRFMVTLQQGIETVVLAFKDMQGGEMYVKKVPSMKIVDIVSAMDDTVELRFIGIRPGEKLHEQMISKEDAPYTFEYEDYYKILPATVSSEITQARTREAKRVHDGFFYSSDGNTDWMPKETIRQWLKEN